MKGRGITVQARVIYRAAFNGDELPKRWRVFFVDGCHGQPGWVRSTRTRSGYRMIPGRALNRLGQCCWSARRIDVVRPSRRENDWPGGWLHTLIHEFIHQRCPRLRHGAEFERLIAAALWRVWES